MFLRHSWSYKAKYLENSKTLLGRNEKHRLEIEFRFVCGQNIQSGSGLAYAENLWKLIRVGLDSGTFFGGGSDKRYKKPFENELSRMKLIYKDLLD